MVITWQLCLSLNSFIYGIQAIESPNDFESIGIYTLLFLYDIGIISFVPFCSMDISQSIKYFFDTLAQLFLPMVVLYIILFVFLSLNVTSYFMFCPPLISTNGPSTKWQTMVGFGMVVSTS